MFRCPWAKTELYVQYHDTEWGVPLHDDRRLFEFLILEGAQAGLSWETILRKRAAYRAAFDDFDPAKVAQYGPRDVERLLADAGIVRHRGKIEAVINNAQRALELVEREGSLAAYLWRYEPDAAHLAAPQTASTSAESIALSRDLKRRGWRFVGTTIVYAFMQAVGMVNDHLTGCFRHAEVKAMGERLA